MCPQTIDYNALWTQFLTQWTRVFQARVWLRVLLSKVPFYHECVVYILISYSTKFDRKWPQFCVFNKIINSANFESRLFWKNAAKLRIHARLEHPACNELQWCKYTIGRHNLNANYVCYARFSINAVDQSLKILLPLLWSVEFELYHTSNTVIQIMRFVQYHSA